MSHNNQSAQSLAPIVLFAYNRPVHTQKVVESLQANSLATESDLYIYSDGPKSDANKESVEQTRSYINSINKSTFKNIVVIERERNYGLADNIIEGVTSVVRKYGKVIVLEDDIVVSKVFLDYMNDALNRYENEQKVWSISAWNFPLKHEVCGGSYFNRHAHCWGWATWESRWQFYRRDVSWALNVFTKYERKYVNYDGIDKGYFKQVELNKSGKLRTWAIFHSLVAIRHDGLTLMPSVSYIRQIGFDGSGVHCGRDNIYESENLNETFPITYPEEIIESSEYIAKIHQWYRDNRLSLMSRVFHKIRRFYNNFKKLS